MPRHARAQRRYPSDSDSDSDSEVEYVPKGRKGADKGKKEAFDGEKARNEFNVRLKRFMKHGNDLILKNMFLSFKDVLDDYEVDLKAEQQKIDYEKLCKPKQPVQGNAAIMCLSIDGMIGITMKYMNSTFTYKIKNGKGRLQVRDQIIGQNVEFKASTLEEMMKVHVDSERLTKEIKKMANSKKWTNEALVRVLAAIETESAGLEKDKDFEDTDYDEEDDDKSDDSSTCGCDHH